MVTKKRKGIFWVLFILMIIGGLALWQTLFTKPLFVLQTDSNVVALTFDDGPLPSRTPMLLELLKKHDVKATFFMIGERIEQYPEIASQVVAEGHLIGNHSYNHPRMTFRTPVFIRNQITRTDSLIKLAGQAEIRFFRPPYLKKFIVLPLVLSSMNKTMVTGNINPPAEYTVPCNPRLVVDQVMEQIVPGSIIYLHDGFIIGDPDAGSHEFVEAVELIILSLRKAGYTFVTL
ncbi:MAG: polysaccharide deacetylase family protein [Bacteroidia bacterium]|nr:polysaccharide deacetylase family protein [Bacteroidia bacterium]